jgi:hypothetical protein
MAKSQVTEQDLEQSLQTLGGFGNLATQKPRRDSPFGSDFARRPEESKPVSEATPQRMAEVSQRSRASGHGVELVEEEREPRLTKRPSTTVPIETISKAASEEKKDNHPKSDTLTERITLQMSPEMRDAVNDYARQLQRRRKDKGERITANSVMRVAIQHFLDNFELERVQGASSEEELFATIQRKIK